MKNRFYDLPSELISDRYTLDNTYRKIYDNNVKIIKDFIDNYKVYEYNNEKYIYYFAFQGVFVFKNMYLVNTNSDISLNSLEEYDSDTTIKYISFRFYNAIIKLKVVN